MIHLNPDRILNTARALKKIAQALYDMACIAGFITGGIVTVINLGTNDHRAAAAALLGLACLTIGGRK